MSNLSNSFPPAPAWPGLHTGPVAQHGQPDSINLEPTRLFPLLSRMETSKSRDGLITATPKPRIRVELVLAPLFFLCLLLPILFPQVGQPVPPPSEDPLNQGPELATLSASSLSKEQFTFLFASALAFKLRNGGVRVTGPLTITFHSEAYESVQASLDNAWTECLNNPDDRREIVDRYLRGFVDAAGEPSKTPPESGKLEDVIPAVLSQKYVNSINQTVDAQSALVTEPLAGDLMIACMFNLGDNFAVITQHHLKDLGVTWLQLKARAIDNLRSTRKPVQLHAMSTIYLVNAGAALNASLLLDDTVWSEISTKVAGDLLVAAPSRDALILTGTGVPGGPIALQLMANKLHKEEHHPISTTMLVRRDGHWKALGQ